MQNILSPLVDTAREVNTQYRMPSALYKPEKNFILYFNNGSCFKRLVSIFKV